MKAFAAVAVAAAVASLSLAPAAFAQADRSPGSSTPSRSTEKDKDKARESFKAPDGTMEAKKIIGTKVKDSSGKDLGEIDQVLIDTKTGKVTHAIIGKGGLVGVGETHVVVPWSSVSLTADADNRDKLVANVEQSALDAAPRWDRRAAASERPAASPRTSDEKRTPEEKKTPSQR